MPFQPGTFFNPDKIEKMAAKFRRYRDRGTHSKTAILVRPIPNRSAYEFVFGESRTIAHAQAGFDTVLAFVDDISDDEARELAVAENWLKKDLNPIEKTEAILRNFETLKVPWRVIPINRSESHSCCEEFSNSQAHQFFATD